MKEKKPLKIFDLQGTDPVGDTRVGNKEAAGYPRCSLVEAIGFGRPHPFFCTVHALRGRTFGSAGKIYKSPSRPFDYG